MLGVRLVHSRPYSPEGRGKQEHANRYIREAFLAEATHVGISSLEELNDRFIAWADQVANLQGPLRDERGADHPLRARRAPPRGVDADRLREAFRWSVTRKVTRTATVPLEGNSYGVDPALVGRRIELRYDPEDLTRIDVFFEGRPAGVATPFVTRRHVAPGRSTAARPEPAATGIDYLGLVAAAHEEAAGTGAKIDFPSSACSPIPAERAHTMTRYPAPWATHFGLRRTPFGKSIAAKDLFVRQAHAEAVARINFCIVESALGVITGDVGPERPCRCAPPSTRSTPHATR